MTTVDELHAGGVGLGVLAGAGAEIDTTTANGRLVFGIFAALAEFERELIAERTRAGLAVARARGRLGGRPRKMDVAMLRMAMRAMASHDTNAHDLAQRLGITTTTLYMYVNGDGTVKEPGQKLLDAAANARARMAAFPQRRCSTYAGGSTNWLPRHAGRRTLFVTVPCAGRRDGPDRTGLGDPARGGDPWGGSRLLAKWKRGLLTKGLN